MYSCSKLKKKKQLIILLLTLFIGPIFSPYVPINQSTLTIDNCCCTINQCTCQSSCCSHNQTKKNESKTILKSNCKIQTDSPKTITQEPSRYALQCSISSIPKIIITEKTNELNTKIQINALYLLDKPPQV